MQRLRSAFSRSSNDEKESILEGSESGNYQKYISINNDASVASSTEDASPVTCPTCRGIGRIPRGQEKELVALIPYSDQRLQPRRTKLYVTVAVGCCLLIFFLIIFFLYPRSVTLDHAGVNSSSVTHDDSLSTVNFETTIKLNISNRNLFAIKILSLNVEVVHMSAVVGTLNLKEGKTVGPLINDQIFYTVTSKIQDTSTFKVCTWDQIKVHNIFLHIQGSLNYTYIGHVEQISFVGNQYLDCKSNTTIPH